MSRTCLIAEADPFIANLLLRFAEESGLSSARAKTGQEILALAPQCTPVVLIVDPELPGELRGWEAVRALHAETQVRLEAEVEDAVLAPALPPTLPPTSPIAVISCSWLKKAETCRLMGDVAWHLQKPDLFYEDFVKALEAAGVAVEDRPGPT